MSKKEIEVPKGHLAIVLTRKQWELVLNQINDAPVPEHPMQARALDDAEKIIANELGYVT